MTRQTKILPVTFRPESFRCISEWKSAAQSVRTCSRDEARNCVPEVAAGTETVMQKAWLKLACWIHWVNLSEPHSSGSQKAQRLSMLLLSVVSDDLSISLSAALPRDHTGTC